MSAGIRATADGTTAYIQVNGVDRIAITPTQITFMGQTYGIEPTGRFGQFMLPAAPTGWIAGDGTTIGNVGSGATRANVDTLALFTAWWAYTDAQLPILTSAGGASTRGVSAAADWTALKRLTVFDVRGRFPRNAGAINGVTFINGTAYSDTYRDHTHSTVSVAAQGTGATTGLIITTTGAPQGGFATAGGSVGAGLETAPASLALLGCWKL